MKRYWLFIFQTFYPNGGMADLYKTFDSIPDCIKCKNKNFDKDQIENRKLHIYDSCENKVYILDHNDDVLHTFTYQQEKFISIRELCNQ